MVKRLIPFLAALLLPVAAVAGDASLQRVAALVFHNECASKVSCLTSWNEGEEFASLGIGHFIWYPAGAEKRFSESFPQLLAFLKERGVTLPAWLSPERGNPWPDRSYFVAAHGSAALASLRQVLIDTQPLQAAFMQQRFEQALPRLLQHAKPDRREHIRSQFRRVLASPMGLYALIDYVNFKGEGIHARERYHDQGWGLLQVLERMHGRSVGIDAIREFSLAADELLTLRVQHSPPERHEARWLPGWRKRLQTYINEAERVFIRKL